MPHAVRPACCGLLPIILLASSTASWADDWYLEPRASMQGFYDDNVGLVVSNPKASTGAVARAAAKMGRRSQVFDISVDAEFIRRQYFNDPSRNSTDSVIDADLVKATRLDRYALNAHLDLDSTVTSELASSGLTRVPKRRVRWQLAPSWRHQLMPLWGVTANASYQDVSYRDAQLTGLVDYTYLTLGADTDYRFDERTQLLGQVSFARYESDQTSTTSDTTGILAGIGYNFSPTWSARALLGLRKTETSQTTFAGTSTVDDTGYLVDISTTKQYQTGALTVGLNQSTNPSGSGELLDSEHLSMDWNQRLSHRWRFTLTADRYKNERSSGMAGTNDRQYLNIRPGLRYKLDREWSLSAAYRYRYQKYDVNPDSATSNALLLTLSYLPVSRK